MTEKMSLTEARWRALDKVGPVPFLWDMVTIAIWLRYRDDGEETDDD